MRANFFWRLPVKGKGNALHVTLLLCIVAAWAGCVAATPVRPETPSRGMVLFPQPSDVVQKAAADALVVTGFDIKKSEPLYVEGYRPHKVGLLVGSGGETVGVWLEKLDSSKTRVRVDTAKSLLGIVGQKNWDATIIEEMKRSLEKRE